VPANFDEVTFHIAHGGLLDILAQPNQQKYPGQRLFVVQLGGYAYLVPFVKTETEYFFQNEHSEPKGHTEICP
jgi:hypothetical protein